MSDSPLQDDEKIAAWENSCRVCGEAVILEQRAGATLVVHEDSGYIFKNSPRVHPATRLSTAIRLGTSTQS